MKSIAIVGAGITGLTAAYTLKKKGVPVTVYEAGTRPGGVIRTVRENGFLAECGPNTLLETSPQIPALFRELGLGGEMLYSDPAAANKYIIRGGRPVSVPGSPTEFLRTDLFSLSAKLRLIREPFVRRSAPEFEESLAAFVVRRLGREFLDYAINPFVAGVYAGDPWKLSVRDAFGKVHALEQRYGSLICGQILGARERKKRGAVSKQNAPKVSFKNGLSTLVETLAAELDVELRYGRALQRVEQIDGGWRLELESSSHTEIEEHSAVLLTVPAYKLSWVPLLSHTGESFQFLDQIRYAPVSSMVFGFRKDQVQHALDGFGFLVPEVERFNILGAIFSSSLFPNRAAEGHVCISCYMGGFRSPGLPFRPKEEQIALALADLDRALGIKGKPTFTNHVVFPKAIPQYEIGYGAIRAQIEGLEQNCPGLHLGGNYYKGVSLGDSIVNGIAYGEQLAREPRPVARFEPQLAAA
jgi:oxygen-dependent protoporphyrinogen oxidase